LQAGSGQHSRAYKKVDPAIRDWYAERAVEHKWRLEVLEHQITTGLHRRVGAAPNNLEERLSEDGAALARSVAKDPLVFDFLGLTKEVEELAMEEAMTQRMSQTLAEFGRGLAFYGRQHHLDAHGVSTSTFSWCMSRLTALWSWSLSPGSSGLSIWAS
jgi:predicted nuclease of restriction endonuclease-like (RecB) superfamily